MKTQNGQFPNENKVKMIGYIDFLDKHFNYRSIWHRELNQMRNKYIYKDISVDEFNKDRDYLRNVRQIVQDYYIEDVFEVFKKKYKKNEHIL